jgi:hypothetical protein
MPSYFGRSCIAPSTCETNEIADKWVRLVELTPD